MKVIDNSSSTANDLAEQTAQLLKEQLIIIPLLTSEECLQVYQTVYELRDFWVKRENALPAYTLGAASYLDAETNRYYPEADRCNPILHHHLDWLYQRLATQLSSHLGMAVAYPPHLSLPGFHIFLAHKAFERPLASRHWDLQYNLLEWDEPEKMDFDHPLSFTLAITLPQHGGGLQTWNVAYELTSSKSMEEINQIAAQETCHYHAYEIGNLVLHSGHVLHRIAPGRNIQFGDKRITLQGHCLKYENTWWLYW